MIPTARPIDLDKINYTDQAHCTYYPFVWPLVMYYGGALYLHVVTFRSNKAGLAGIMSHVEILHYFTSNKTIRIQTKCVQSSLRLKSKCWFLRCCICVMTRYQSCFVGLRRVFVRCLKCGVIRSLAWPVMSLITSLSSRPRYELTDDKIECSLTVFLDTL